MKRELASRKLKKTTVYLTPELHKAIREHCKRKSIYITDYIEALVSKSLKRN